MITPAARPVDAPRQSFTEGALSGAKVGAIGGSVIGAATVIGGARALLGMSPVRAIATGAAGIGLLALAGAGFGAASGALATRADTKDARARWGALGGAAAGLVLLSVPMALSVRHGGQLPATPFRNFGTTAQLIVGGLGGGALIGAAIGSRT